MPRRKKGQEPKRPAGAARKDPTQEQKERLPELKERARQIYLLGQEDELWSQAAALIREADARIEDALDVRYQRRVSVDRPMKVPCDEIVALEDLEQKLVASRRNEMARSGQHREEEQAAARLVDAAMYPEPVNRRVKAARCLLRYAEEMLRAEVGLAANTEEVPTRGETEAQILDRLVKSELGLRDVAAARLLGKPEDHEAAEGKAANRRAEQTKRVFDPLKALFMKGFTESGAKLDPQDEAKLDQIIRQTLTAAAADPDMDRETILVNTKNAGSVEPRRKRKVASGEVMMGENSGEMAEKDPTVLDVAVGSQPAPTFPRSVPQTPSVVDDVATAAWRQR
jgi:hypothetical protein